MKLGIVVVFIISFISSYLGMEGLSVYMSRAQEKNEKKQNQIILEDIKYRFQLFLDIQTSIGTIASDHFGRIDRKLSDYGPLQNARLFEINRQVIGFNILNDKGVIESVFPYEANKKALGLQTQNYSFLKTSYEKGEVRWFSPPFTLFQGGQGFAIYFPITLQHKLKGWFASVVSTNLFRNDFDVREFLSTYELAIIDNQSNRPYYSTATVPDEDIKKYSTSGVFQDRPISFIIWKKSQEAFVLIPTSLKIGGSFLFSLLMILVFRFYDQRKRARIQLKDISTILSLTSRDALARLIDLQQEIFKVGNLENVRYVTNLIEQVDLLQSTANERVEIGQEEINILPLLLSELEEVKYLITKKELHVKFNQEKFANIEITTNPWLFKNNVMGSILTYAIIHAQHGSGLSIECHQMFGRHILTFHTERTYDVGSDQAINLDRRIEVARRILNLSRATIKIDHDHAGGMIIRLEFP